MQLEDWLIKRVNQICDMEASLSQIEAPDSCCIMLKMDFSDCSVDCGSSCLRLSLFGDSCLSGNIAAGLISPEAINLTTCSAVRGDAKLLYSSEWSFSKKRGSFLGSARLYLATSTVCTCVANGF